MTRLLQTPMNLTGSVVLIVVGAISFATAWRLSRRAQLRSWTGARLWFVIAAVLTAAAIYRFLGVEHRLSDDFRAAAREENWYDNRRVFQALATSALMIAAATAFVVVARWRAPAAARLAAGALLAYLILSILRIVSLHIVDSLLYRGVGGFHLNWAIEAVILGVIGGSAIVASRGGERRAQRP